LQRAFPGAFTATLTLAYTEAELAVAGIAPHSVAERGLVIATFEPGACMTGGAACPTDGDCGANGPCVGAGYTSLPTTIDPFPHTATAPGITHFSIFAVMEPTALTPGVFVKGGGTARGDCHAVWQVVAAPDTVGPSIVCQDGDPSCDGDADPGVCTFRVGVCFNLIDPLPSCTPAAIQKYTLSKPSLRSRNESDRSSAADLLDALVALGGTRVRPAPVVKYSPPFSSSACSALVKVRVSAQAGGGAGMVLRGQARAKGGGDADKLRLVCQP